MSLTKVVIEKNKVKEAGREKIAQKHVTVFYGSKAVGSIIGAWQSTVLMEFYGNRGIFYFSSFLPLAVMIYCSFFYEEYRYEGMFPVSKMRMKVEKNHSLNYILS